jgi:hypothetical protein
MENTVIGIIASVVNVAIVYFGINTYHLQFLPMLGVLLAFGVIGTLITREIDPPSKVLKQALATIKNGNYAMMDIGMIVGFIAFIAMAILLWKAYGGLRWFAIFVLTSIAVMATEFI